MVDKILSAGTLYDISKVATMLLNREQFSELFAEMIELGIAFYRDDFILEEDLVLAFKRNALEPYVRFSEKGKSDYEINLLHKLQIIQCVNPALKSAVRDLLEQFTLG